MSDLPNTLSDVKKERLLTTWMPKNFDLLGYVVRVLRRWPYILAATLAGLLLGLYLGLQEPRYYASFATFMPPPAELNSTAPAGTSLSLLSASLQGDMYLFLLQTRTLTADVVKSMGLAEHYGTDPETARYYLMKRSTFDVQRSAVVTVFFRDKDPLWAAKVANGYIDALYRMEGNMVTSAYAHRREFFEERLRKTRADMEQKEDELAASQQKLGNLQGDVGAGVEQGTEIGLQGQIDTLDTQIAIALKSQTEQNPQVMALRIQQNALRAQLAQVKSTGLNPNRGIQGLRGLPQIIVKQNRRQRDLGERTTVYNGVMNRYQISQAAEVDPGPQFETIDAAIPSPVLEPSKVPKYTTAGAAAGCFAGIFLLFAFPVVTETGRTFRSRLREDQTRGEKV